MYIEQTCVLCCFWGIVVYMFSPVALWLNLPDFLALYVLVNKTNLQNFSIIKYTVMHTACMYVYIFTSMSIIESRSSYAHISSRIS